MRFDRRLFRLVKNEKVLLFLTITFGSLGGLCIILQARILAHIVNLAIFIEDQHDFFSLGLAVFGIILLRALVQYLSEISALEIALRIKTRMRMLLIEASFQEGPLSPKLNESGKLTTLVMDGIESLEAYFSQYLPQLALAVTIPLLILIYIFPIDLTSTIILVLTAPLIPLFMSLISHQADLETKKQWNALISLGEYFLDSLKGLTTLKLSGIFKERFEKMKKINRDYERATLRVMRITFLSALLLEFVTTLSTAIVAVEIGLRLLYGQLAFESAFFILLLCPDFYQPLRQLGVRFHAALNGLNTSTKIWEFLGTNEVELQCDDMKSQIIESVVVRDIRPQEEITHDLNDVFSDTYTLQFSNVKYRYPNRIDEALKGISFSITRGQKIALVGKSGCGKSTIFSLLLRFIKCDEGEITIDSFPIDQIPLDTWYSQFSWVSQQPYFFNGTIQSNLRLAKPEASADEIRDILEEAQLSDFVDRLPDGINTLVGEKGIRLSGGEAQRLAFARAFLHCSPLILMDEPTSNIDPDLENRLLIAQKKLLAGKTTLIIAHRFSSIIDADQIIVLDDGQIMEMGNYEALYKRNGTFKTLQTRYPGFSIVR